MFALFKRNKADDQRVSDLYTDVVEQARQPDLYATYLVPDTVDGRFEMICLHAALYMIRLNRLGELEFCQKFFDRIFIEMDRACREMGIGDLSVPKHIKKMMVAFNGRVQVYKEALESNDTEIIANALFRNIYNSDEILIDESRLEQLATYVQNNYQVLASADAEMIKTGAVELKPINKTAE